MSAYRIQAAIGVAALLLLFAPNLLGSYRTGLLTLVLIYAIFAMSLDILQGYTGLPSLGHAAFWGSSAYAVALLNTRLDHGGGLGLEIAAGMASAVLVAALLGLIVLRSRGVYLLMILMASSMMLWGIAFKWRSLTGGDDGLHGVVRPAFFGFPLDDPDRFYYFVLLAFAIATGLMWTIVRSSFGNTLVGIRENETRMRALGYNVWLHKYVAFMISALFAGVAGALIAYHNNYVGPTDLHLITSAEALIMVIVGGAGTLLGPILGAFIVILIKNFVSGYTEHWMLILGTLYLLTGMYAPHGLYPLVHRLAGRRS